MMKIRSRCDGCVFYREYAFQDRRRPFRRGHCGRDWPLVQHSTVKAVTRPKVIACDRYRRRP